MPYTRRGLFHLSLTAADVPTTVGAVTAAGGALVSDPVEFVPGRPWVVAYCRDPWGAYVELVSASYPECFANWPQPRATGSTVLLSRDGIEHPA